MLEEREVSEEEDYEEEETTSESEYEDRESTPSTDSTQDIITKKLREKSKDYLISSNSNDTDLDGI